MVALISPGASPYRAAFARSMSIWTVGWPSDVKTRQIGDSLYGGQHRFNVGGGVGERLEIVAKQLDRVFTLNSRYGLRNVILKVLREIEFNPGELILQFRQQSTRQFFLVMGIGPFVDRLQRRKEFRIEKPGSVGAVIRSAMLRYHRFHLGKAADHLAHFV